MVGGSFFGLKKLQCRRYWVIFSRDPANKNPTELFSCLVGCSMLQQVVFHFLAPFGELGSLSSPKLKRLWKTAYLLCISYELVAQMPKWKSWWLDSSKFFCLCFAQGTFFVLHFPLHSMPSIGNCPHGARWIKVMVYHSKSPLQLFKMLLPSQTSILRDFNSNEIWYVLICAYICALTWIKSNICAYFCIARHAMFELLWMQIYGFHVL